MKAPSDEESNDGRRARGARTRHGIIGAFLDLTNEGNFSPTMAEVAERADVALRTVYHHFEGAEGFRLAAFTEIKAGPQDRVSNINPSENLEERITQFANWIRTLYEAVTAVRKAATMDRWSSVATAKAFERSDQFRRQQLERVFARELGRGRSRNQVLDALDAASSWETWNYLRSGLGRSVRSSQQIAASSLRSILKYRT